MVLLRLDPPLAPSEEAEMSTWISEVLFVEFLAKRVSSSKLQRHIFPLPHLDIEIFYDLTLLDLEIPVTETPAAAPVQWR